MSQHDTLGLISYPQGWKHIYQMGSQPWIASLLSRIDLSINKQDLDNISSTLATGLHIFLLYTEYLHKGPSSHSDESPFRSILLPHPSSHHFEDIDLHPDSSSATNGRYDCALDLDAYIKPIIR